MSSIQQLSGSFLSKVLTFSLEEYFSGLFCYRLYIPPPKIFVFACMIGSTYEKCELPLFLLTSHQMQLHHTSFGAYVGISTKDLLWYQYFFCTNSPPTQCIGYHSSSFHTQLTPCTPTNPISKYITPNIKILSHPISKYYFDNFFIYQQSIISPTIST